MDYEVQDPENAMETHYNQEFEMLKGMFEDHFSADLIAGVLEDCEGDVNLAVDTLTKLEACTDESTERLSENMATNANTSFVANSNTETVQNMATDNTNPSYANSFLNTATPPSAPLSVKTTPNPRHTKLRIDYWTDQLRKLVAEYHEGHRVLIIMRGAPGSGKSYLARAIVDHTVGTANSNNLLNFIFSADDFFVRNGKYQYDVSRLDEVHTKNRKRVSTALSQGRSPVIVDNTNMTSWEMQPYVHDGVRNGYIIEIIEPSTPWAMNATQLAKKNSHGVPKDKIQRMLERYEGKYTGMDIIKYFNLSYPRDRIPPVRRNIPPFPLNAPIIITPPRALPTFNETRNSSESQSKQENKNSAPVKLDFGVIPTQAEENDKSSISYNNATLETDEPTNVRSQMQQKMQEVQKYFEEICKVEEEWEKGDSWDAPSSNRETRMESAALKPKPQRSNGSNEDTGNLLEPAMVCDDWTKIAMFMPPWYDDKTVAVEQISQIQVQMKTSATWVETDDFINEKYKILIAIPRNINNSTDNTNERTEKIPNQRMLDKSTTTHEPSVNGIYRCKKEDKHFVSLKKMFKNISRPVLRDIFDQCCGDVNWASSIVLEGMENNSLQISNTEDSDTEEEELDFCECWATYNIIPDKTVEPISPLPVETPTQIPTPIFKKKPKKDKILSDGSIQLKRQIEKNVTISENHYSNHLKLLKFRREVYSPTNTGKVSTVGNENNGINETIQPVDTEIDANSQTTALLDNAVPSTSHNFQYPGNPNTSYSNDFDNNVEPSTSGIRNTQSDEFLLDDLYEEDSDDDKSVASGDNEMVSVNLGMDFVSKMDEVFDRKGFEYPRGVKTVVNIPRSLLQVINAYWVESIACQLDNYQKQTEEMIRQDEEFARQLMQAEAEAEAEEYEEDNAQAAAKAEPHEPSFKEIMDTELALAIYEKEVKEEWKNKEPQDLAAKMTREKLYNLFPDVANETLSEMLIAHDNSFEATVESLLVSTGQSHYLEQNNGINKFVMEKEIEKRDKVLEEQKRDLDEEFPPLYTKIGEQKPEVTMDVVNKMRDKAEHHRNARDVYQKRAQFYMSRKLFSEASYYSQIASMQTRKFEHTNHYAAATLIYFHSSMRPEANIIDLHYLRVAEASNALDIYLDERLATLRRSRARFLTIHVITGRGKHSNGRARVKPAIMRRLQQRGVTFHHQNPGLLEAKLKPTHLLTNELKRS